MVRHFEDMWLTGDCRLLDNTNNRFPFVISIFSRILFGDYGTDKASWTPTSVYIDEACYG